MPCGRQESTYISHSVVWLLMSWLCIRSNSIDLVLESLALALEGLKDKTTYTQGLITILQTSAISFRVYCLSLIKLIYYLMKATYLSVCFLMKQWVSFLFFIFKERGRKLEVYGWIHNWKWTDNITTTKTNKNMYIFYGIYYPDSKVHGANMGPIWGRQDPGGPHVGPMNFAIWASILLTWSWWFNAVNP